MLQLSESPLMKGLFRLTSLAFVGIDLLDMKQEQYEHYNQSDTDAQEFPLSHPVASNPDDRFTDHAIKLYPPILLHLRRL